MFSNSSITERQPYTTFSSKGHTREDFLSYTLDWCSNWESNHDALREMGFMLNKHLLRFVLIKAITNYTVWTKKTFFCANKQMY